MNSIKPIAIIAVLAMAGVGLFMKMNGGPEPEPPQDFTGSWGSPPLIDMPGVSDSAAAQGGPGVESPLPASSAPAWGGGGAGAGLPVTESPPPFADRPPTGVSPSFSPPDVSQSLPAGVPAATAPQPGATTAAPSAGGSLYARSLPNALRNDETAIMEAGPASNADPSATFSAARKAVYQALDQGDLAQAHLLLSRWYGDPSLTDGDQREMSGLLSQLAGTVVYSEEHHLQPAYEPQPGETLEEIAAKFRVPWQLLAKVNGIAQPDQLPAGQGLKVVQGPFAAVVRMDRREMALMVGGRYAGRFVVGLGREHEDVEGEWEVRHKMTNPTYYGRDRVIDADDPSNPLGEHWLGLARTSADGTGGPFGIHGTNDPQSMQRDDPRGYIRLAPQDAEDVYNILSVGSKVVIRR